MNQITRVGVAGLGTVGSSVIQVLERQQEVLATQTGRTLQVTSISARSPDKVRSFALDPFVWHSDPVALAASPEIDIFVELIGGGNGPALESVKQALEAGKSVVTANKALLAEHGLMLAELAERNGVSLAFEAAVGGGIPIIKALKESLSGNRLSRIYGILNGTCNYILSRMESEGITFEDCLSEAQRLGYAEADPTFDVDGVDTAHKLAILTSLAFGTQISKDDIFIEGITRITPEDIAAADELGYRIRLLGVAQVTDTGIEQRVHPTMVAKDSPIARITGVTNAISIDGDIIGTAMLAGPGAGGDATASAVVGDLVDLARGYRAPALGRGVSDLVPYRRAGMRAHQGGYYLRLNVPDRPGGFAAIAACMAQAGISLDSIVQRNRPANAPPVHEEHETQSVIIITHDTEEQTVRKALEKIVQEGDVAGEPQMIRIERL